MSGSRPVTALASFTAAMFDSVPEFVKRQERQAEAAVQLLGDLHRLLGGGAEVGAERGALADRRDDRGVGVALDHRAEAVVEVDVLVAVDVPDARALAALDVDGPRVAARGTTR